MKTTKIVRTKTRAEGGLTELELTKMKDHADMWIKRVLRTEPIDKAKIVPAIEGLYAAANLPKPRVIIVPSPLVMAFASSFAAVILKRKTHDVTDDATVAATEAATRVATVAATRGATDDATYDATDTATRSATYDATGAATDAATRVATFVATFAATRDATDDATRSATYAATRAATRSATEDVTYAATRAATNSATRAATEDATEDATLDATLDATRSATEDATDEKWYVKLSKEIAKGDDVFQRQLLKECANWYIAYQGGNMWGAWASYLSAARDILGLELPEYAKYKFWEDAAIHGGFRAMHPTFCMVSDFPEFIHQHPVTKQPHSEYGPSHRWRDGWELYHLHGIRFEKEMYWKIMKQEMSFKEILGIQDIDKRMVAMRYCKPLDLFKGTNAELVFKKSARGNELWKIPQASGVFDRDEYFLHYFCPSSGREYIKGVDPEQAKVNKYNGDTLMALSHGFSLDQYLDKEFVSV